jgi:hypothetical protein
MVSRRMLFIRGQCREHKKYFLIVYRKKNKSAMLDASIPTQEALVHTIPISDVKDMKSDVSRALYTSLSSKIIL